MKKNNRVKQYLLRLAFKKSPNEAKKLMKKINLKDKKISKLLNKLS